jgi:hypothetical protein
MLNAKKKLNIQINDEITSISIWRSCNSAASASEPVTAKATAAEPVTAKFWEIFQKVCNFSVNNPSKSPTKAWRKYSGGLGASKSKLAVEESPPPVDALDSFLRCCSSTAGKLKAFFLNVKEWRQVNPTFTVELPLQLPEHALQPTMVGHHTVPGRVRIGVKDFQVFD